MLAHLLHAQELPKGLAPHERDLIPAYRASRAASMRGIAIPPAQPVRTMAEWEEVKTLCVTWRSYPVILKQIVRHARLECEVLIICDATGTNSQANIISYLQANNAGGPPLPDLSNISFLVAPSNSIWIRDYGPESMYFNEVDSLVLMDWIYNRPRPADDALSDAIGSHLGHAVFSSTQAPNDLVHTGGNFMADGFGTGFSSKLVDLENGPGAQYNQTVKTPAQVDALMGTWMGIGPYVKMDELPFDNISHIDMHMKLLDEERLLVGEFPQGVSDGPQIEANLQYIAQNFTSVFGTPYELVRIPMVPSTGGAWPPTANYRTYANALFVNKLILVPTYREQFDTTGLRIWRQAMPGYRVVGIDCDNTDANIISASGAIHCITKTIGVRDPLLIRHQRLRDAAHDPAGHEVKAYIRHRSGVLAAQVYWTLDTTAGYTAIPMTDLGSGQWSAMIPPQANGGTVYYYIRAEAINGKVQVRPIVAPHGWWRFTVTPATGIAIAPRIFLEGPYDAQSGLMKDDLRAAGLIPTSEPFTGLGFTLIGGAGTTVAPAVVATSGPNAVVDWVLVEVRAAGDPTTILRTRPALVQRDGDVVATDGSSPVQVDLPPGLYHVAMRHRNHLGVMTASPLSLGSSPTGIDLTLPGTATYGANARKVLGNVRVLWAGDVLRDGVLKYAGSGNDRDPILTAIGGAVPTSTVVGQYRQEDVNLDGTVKYAGSANDRDVILLNVGGAVPTATRTQQLP